MCLHVRYSEDGARQAEHPGVLRMADVGAAAGRAWQALDAEKRATYEQQSRASKVHLPPNNAVRHRSLALSIWEATEQCRRVTPPAQLFRACACTFDVFLHMYKRP